MPLVFRVDADSKIGIGHVTRCLSLASYARNYFQRIIFFGYWENDNILKKIVQEGFSYSPIKKSEIEDKAQISCFLQSIDVPVLKDGSVDKQLCWFIVDGYHFDSDYLAEIKKSGCKLLFIDDEQKLSEYYSDIVVNQNPEVDLLKYPLSSGMLVLFGSGYRIIDTKYYLRVRKNKRRIADRASKILVTFGGADSKNVTNSILKALNETGVDSINVKVIVGPANRHYKSLAKTVLSLNYKVELVSDIEDMVPFMEWADLAISAGGGTCWELSMMGVPSILVSVAENQDANVRFMCSIGSAVSLGNTDSLGSSVFKRIVSELIDSQTKRSEMSIAGRKFADGVGAERIIKMVHYMSGAISFDDMNVRPAIEADIKQIYRLASDPLVRNNSFSQGSIDFQDHKCWFREKLVAKDKTAVWVMEFGGTIIGQIRYDRVSEEEAEIDFSVHPSFRNKGVGLKLICLTCRKTCEALSVSNIIGVVKRKNNHSKRCFEKAGFRQIEEKVVKNEPVFLYQYSI